MKPDNSIFGALRRQAAGRVFILTAVFCLWAFPGLSAQTNRSFNVTADLQTGIAAPNTVFCRSSTGTGTFGATVTIVCSTGAVVDISAIGTGAPWKPIHGGAYRFLTYVSRAGELLGTIESDVGTGTVSSWRVVHLANRDYIEMTLGW